MSSDRRHTVLAVVFASLDEANPCSLSNDTARRTLLFRLTAALRRRSEGGTTRVLYAALVLPHLDSFSFEKVSRQVRTRVVGVYPLSPKPPTRRLGGCGVAVAQAEPGLVLRLWMLRLMLLRMLLRRRLSCCCCGGCYCGDG